MMEQYTGRPKYVVPTNISLDREAREYLDSLCGAHNRGRVVSRLLQEERARREKR